MRKKEHEKRMAAAATVNTFSYDLDACRQYQSRGAASMGPNMSVSAPPAHSSVYGASSTSAFGGPSNVMYNWAPGAAGGGYGDGSGHGTGAHGNGGASMGYGMPYNSMSYHGMPSPEASYLVSALSLCSHLAFSLAFSLLARNANAFRREKMTCWIDRRRQPWPTPGRLRCRACRRA